MSEIMGANVKLYINTTGETYVTLGNEQDVSIGHSVDMIDISNKSSTARRRAYGKHEFPITATCLYEPTNAAQAALFTARTNRTSIDIRIYENSEAEYQLTTLVTSLDISAPDGDKTTLSISLASHGDLSEL